MMLVSCCLFLGIRVAHSLFIIECMKKSPAGKLVSLLHMLRDLFGLFCSIPSKQIMGLFIKPAVH